MPNVDRSPRQTAATREAPAAVWRRAGGLVGHSSHLVGRKRNLSSLTVVFDRGLVFRQSELEPIDLPENWVWEAH